MSEERFQEELGVYIGLLTTGEAIKTLAEHTPGEWVMLLHSPDGELVWRKTGWSWEIAEGESVMFAAASRGSGAGNPAMYTDAVVLSFAKDMDLKGSCEQYSGGLVFRFGFGDWEGHTLTMLAWQSVLHVTESGDVAPGFGEVEVELRGGDDG